MSLIAQDVASVRQSSTERFQVGKTGDFFDSPYGLGNALDHDEKTAQLMEHLENFDKLDENKDGKITEQELKNVMTRLGVDASLVKNYTKSFFRKYDKDNSGYVTADEMLAIVRSSPPRLGRALPPLQSTAVDTFEMKQNFEAADENGDGVLNLQELQNLLHNQGESKQNAQKMAKQVFELFGEDADGTIEFKHFFAEYIRLKDFRVLVSLKKRALESVDSLHPDGGISKEDLMEALTENYGVRAAQRKLDELFAKIDVNNDGTITASELVNYHEQVAKKNAREARKAARKRTKMRKKQAEANADQKRNTAVEPLEQDAVDVEQAEEEKARKRKKKQSKNSNESTSTAEDAEPVVESVNKETVADTLVEPESSLSLAEQPAAEEEKAQVDQEPVVEEQEAQVDQEPVAQEQEAQVDQEPVVEEQEAQVDQEPVVEEQEAQVDQEPVAQEQEAPDPVEEEAKGDAACGYPVPSSWNWKHDNVNVNGQIDLKADGKLSTPWGDGAYRHGASANECIWEFGGFSHTLTLAEDKLTFNSVREDGNKSAATLIVSEESQQSDSGEQQSGQGSRSSSRGEKRGHTSRPSSKSGGSRPESGKSSKHGSRPGSAKSSKHGSRPGSSEGGSPRGKGE